MAAAEDPPPIRVPQSLVTAAAYAWRLLVVAAVVIGVLLLMGRTLVVVVPVAVAALLARALWPVRGLLLRWGARPALAAAGAIVTFLIAVLAVAAVVGLAFANEVDDLGPTLSEGIEDVEDWLVEDSPWDISRADLDRWTDQAGDVATDFLRSSEGSVLSGAAVAGEIVVGTLLSIIVAFFILKDGTRMSATVLGWVDRARRPNAEHAAEQAWDAAGGYLRGAALLGLVEGTIIGLTLLLVGGGLVVPVVLITFLLAFVPIVGAVTAGVIAVLVALVTAGPIPALIVGIVVLVVQQLDNDLLAPVIYGRSLQLHPLTILLGITAAGSLFGFVGTFLAVPVLAVTINAVAGYRNGPDDDDVGCDGEAASSVSAEAR